MVSSETVRVTASVGRAQPVTPPAPISYVPQWPATTVEVGDRSFNVRFNEPAGTHTEPVLFIHGLGGSSTNWTELMGLLSDRVQGIAPDLSGHGRSAPAPDNDYDVATHARYMKNIAEQWFDGRPFHVVGNSLGGATSVQLAARYPEVVRSVTLVSPALPDLKPRLTNIHMPVMAIPGFGENLTKLFLTRSAESRARANLQQVFADPSRCHPQRLADNIAEAKERDELDYGVDAVMRSLRGLAKTYFDRSDEQPWLLAERIHAPVLAIYGKNDRLVMSKTAHKANRVFDDVRVLVIPNCGHVAQMEHPDVVAKAWRQMVDAHFS